MEFPVFQFSNGESWILTTDSPASHYRIPVFRYTGCSCLDRGPADQLCEHAWTPNLVDFFGACTAADAVYQYVTRENHTPEQMQAAKLFLNQWPDGPQL